MTRPRTDGVLRAACNTPWAILPEKLEAIFDVLEFHAEGLRLTKDEIEARIGPTAGPRSLPPVANGSVAVLPLYGVISQRMNMLSDVSGGTSTEKFAAELDALVANPNVSAIVIDTDSPGGSTAGVPELAAKIRAARDVKPIYAVANGLMASAAYWLASQATQIIASPSAFVGSIGVFAVHLDDTQALAKDGMTRTVISAGKYKAEGIGPLTAEAKDAAQATVDQMYSMFVGDVAAGRGVSATAVQNGYGEGRAVLASDAMSAGMVDRIATMDDVLKELTGSHAPPGRFRADAQTLTLAAQSSGFFVPAASTTGALASANTHTPLVLHSSTAAPKAKEQTVSDSLPVAQVNGATPTDPTVIAMQTEASRRESINQLCALAGASAADANAFIASGKTADDVRAELSARREPPKPLISVGNDRAEARPFAQAGDFYAAVMAAAIPGNANNIDPRLRPLASASGMNQGVGSEGGFTVPPAFSSTIWDRLSDPGESLLARTDNYTVTGESLTFNANAETSRATGSRYGGVQGYWIAEADQITSSKPKFRQVKLEPHGLAVLVYVTDKLLKNSQVALGQYVDRAAGDEINFLVTDSIVNGVGAGQPKGLLNSACAVSVAKETNQTATTINQKNISKMWARLHPRARANAVWLHNVDIEGELDNLSTVVMNVAGTENVGGYANKVFDPGTRLLKGRPLIACESCATLGTVGDIILTDLGYYATGTQGGIDTAMSMHLRFDYAETAFRFMFAVDGQSWLQSALTPFKGSNTLSSIVTLATRS